MVEEAKRSGELSGEELASLVAVCPITRAQNAQGQNVVTYNSLPYSVIRDLQRAVTDTGLQSTYVRGLLEALGNGYTLLPTDWKQVMRTIWTAAQYVVWESELKQLALARAAAGEGQYTVDQLTGDGAFSAIMAQAQLPDATLQVVSHCMQRAFAEIPATGTPTLSFTNIHQGPTEPYLDFINRLTEAIRRQIDNPEAAGELLLKLAKDNANADCRKALQPLAATNPSLADMIKTCQDIGTESHKMGLLAAALTQGSKPRGNCFRCKQPGHFFRDCKSTVTPQRPPKEVSQMWQRISLGKPVQEPSGGKCLIGSSPDPGQKGGPHSIAPEKPEAPQAEPRSGIDLSLQAAVHLSLPGEVREGESQIQGPLPQDHLGLVLPRAHMGKRSIFVIPGIIDPGHQGTVKMQLWSTLPQVLEEGESPAQLILIPQTSSAMGSPGIQGEQTLVAYTQCIGQERPMLTINLESLPFSGLLGTGVDITVIREIEWPAVWPTEQVPSGSPRGASSQLESERMAWHQEPKNPIPNFDIQLNTPKYTPRARQMRHKITWGDVKSLTTQAQLQLQQLQQEATPENLIAAVLATITANSVTIICCLLLCHLSFCAASPQLALSAGNPGSMWTRHASYMFQEHGKDTTLYYEHPSSLAYAAFLPAAIQSPELVVSQLQNIRKSNMFSMPPVTLNQTKWRVFKFSRFTPGLCFCCYHKGVWNRRWRDWTRARSTLNNVKNYTACNDYFWLWGKFNVSYVNKPLSNSTVYDIYPNLPSLSAEYSAIRSLCSGWQIKDENLWFFFDGVATNYHPGNYQCVALGYLTLPVQVAKPSNRHKRELIGKLG
ncbi:hypothetical protein JRQ81_012303 [Phrynocephalus forsythii]|uniref:Gag polyprotein n=1 Tax=Phrynocephalus forsythii TaxID=171643 RepID=A0A9Q1AQ26_9SAUR|nr:hypothetical protein JRQ81_012303 [Phrynocephalus forsythii]